MFFCPSEEKNRLTVADLDFTLNYDISLCITDLSNLII